MGAIATKNTRDGPNSTQKVPSCDLPFITSSNFKFITTECVSEIFISDQKMLRSDADSVIHRGFRQISQREGATAWYQNKAFREDLYRHGGIWTSDIGVTGSIYSEIEPDGTIKPVKDTTFDKLAPQRRAFLLAGPGQVMLDGYLFGKSQRLGITSVTNPEPYRVAYIRDEEQHVELSEFTDFELHIRAQKELDNLLKSDKARPEELAALIKLVRQLNEGTY